jgi:hypothetical protein
MPFFKRFYLNDEIQIIYPIVKKDQMFYMNFLEVFIVDQYLEKPKSTLFMYNLPGIFHKGLNLEINLKYPPVENRGSEFDQKNEEMEAIVRSLTWQAPDWVEPSE